MQWQGEETVSYIGECSALRKMNYHDLEFWDLEMGQLIHTDRSERHQAFLHSSGRAGVLCGVQPGWRRETEAFRLEFDYDLG